MAYLRLQRFDGRRELPLITVPKQKQPNRNPIQLPLFEASSLVRFDPQLDPSILPAIAEHLNSGSKTMIRTAVFHPSTIFAELNRRARPSSDVQVWNLDGIEFTVTPKRLYAFLERLRCATCSVEGLAFYVEKHVNETQPVYLNLYGRGKRKSSMTLLTCDHILPDSYGGRYHKDNFQTMCTSCNGNKANRMSSAEIKLVLGNPSQYAKDWLDKEFISSLLELHLEINKGKDHKQTAGLRSLLNRHIKSVSHATKPHQYAAMTAEIQRTLKKHEQIIRWMAIKSWFKHLIPRTFGRLFSSVVKNSS